MNNENAVNEVPENKVPINGENNVSLNEMNKIINYKFFSL